MLKLLITLNTIRLRKILPKDDYLAYLLFFAFYGVLVYFLSSSYSEFSKYILLFSLEILRKDYLLILFIEYVVYSLPVLTIIAINKDFLNLLIYMALLCVFTILPKFNFKIIKFPFQLFDPFWTISFRKYKLYLFLPLLAFISIMAHQSANDNLNYFNILLVSLLGTIPSFQRENAEHIKISAYAGKSYLLQQLKTVLFNTLFIAVPLLGLLLFQNWNLLLFLPVVFLVPVVSILFKYAFFDNIFLHVIFFTLFFGNIQYGIPLLLIPFLYHYSLQKINTIQYAQGPDH